MKRQIRNPNAPKPPRADCKPDAPPGPVTNHERAEAICPPVEAFANTGAEGDSFLREEVVDAITEALDEAEARGGETNRICWAEALDAVLWLHAILDKVIEMDTCGPEAVCDPRAHNCDDTGLGPIARMVKEARLK